MGGQSQGVNSKDTAIFWVGSVFGLTLVAFNLGAPEQLQSIMVVWIFNQNVLFNAAITALHPARRARRAHTNIFVKLVLPARQHKAMRLYRIWIQTTCLLASSPNRQSHWGYVSSVKPVR